MAERFSPFVAVQRLMVKAMPRVASFSAPIVRTIPVLYRSLGCTEARTGSIIDYIVISIAGKGGNDRVSITSTLRIQILAVQEVHGGI